MGALSPYREPRLLQDERDDGTVESKMDADDECVGITGRRGSAGSRMKEQYASQFLQPEWLVDIPEGLGNDWCYALLSLGRIAAVLTMPLRRFVMPRPEGVRCLVISQRHACSLFSQMQTAQQHIMLAISRTYCR